MAAESIATGSNRRIGGGLPLIWCDECCQRRVVKRRSGKEWSLGEIFYVCPNYKRDGSGCPFWYWEEEYMKLLEKKGLAGTAFGDLRMQAGDSRIQGDEGRIEGDEGRKEAGVGHNAISSQKEVSQLKKIGKEILNMLKAICFVCVCVCCL
ncbi:unnamed protein product [Urochloa humidicola]